MTQIPSHDILEGLYKIKNTRVWQAQDRIGIVQYGDSSEESRTWLSQIEDDGKKKYRAEFENEELWSQKWPPWSRMRGQNSVNKEVLETVGKGKLTGNVREETIAVSDTIKISVQNRHSRTRLRILSCSRVRDASRTSSPRGRSPSGRMFRLPCKDYLKGTGTTPFCEKWHPPECLFYKSENGCRFGEKCSYAHRQVDEQPSKKSKMKGDRIAVAFLKNTRQLGCVFQDMEPPKSSSILRKSSSILKPIRGVQFTKAVLRHAYIRDKNPSLGMICPCGPHQRNPNAPTFEDRSQEETGWQEQGAREAAWKLARCILKLKEKHKTTFFCYHFVDVILFFRWKPYATRILWTEHPHTSYFLAHLHTFHPHGSRCCSACLIKTCSSTCHHVSDRALSPIDLFLSFECLYFFVHSLHLLHPDHHPPCGRNRRALNSLRTRRMRSIARGDTQPSHTIGFTRRIVMGRHGDVLTRELAVLGEGQVMTRTAVAKHANDWAKTEKGQSRHLRIARKDRVLPLVNNRTSAKLSSRKSILKLRCLSRADCTARCADRVLSDKVSSSRTKRQ